MNSAVIQKAVEMAFTSGDRARICFFGGEPFLEFEKIKEAVQLAKMLSRKHNRPVQFSVTTNGTLIKKSVLDFLSENAFHLVFSVDGTQKAHEATRPYANGASSFGSIITHLSNALKRMPTVETLSVIDPANIGELSNSFIFFLNLGIRNINFSINYEAEWSKQTLNRLHLELDQLSRVYINSYRQDMKFNFDLFDSKIITHLKDGYACNDRCQFGNGEVCVAPSGNIYPCERLVGEDNDNVQNELVIGHIDTGIDLKKVSVMAGQKNRPDPDCRDCQLQNRCMFWCGCVNYALTGNVGETPGILCQLEQIVIDCADKAAGTLYQEKNPLFLKKFYQV